MIGDKTLISVRKWIIDLKEKSWNTELLVATGSGLSLLKLSKQVELYKLKMWDTFDVSNSFYSSVAQVFSILLLAISKVCFLLACVFIVCIVVRALWIAYIGLYSLFPNGISKEKLNFKPIYLKNIPKRFTAYKNIIYFNSLSSAMYSMAFFIALLFIGLTISLCPIAFILNYSFSALIENYIILVILITIASFFYLLFLFIYFLDILLLFKIRKKFSGFFFYKIYKYSRIMTLGGLYEWILLTFVSNSTKRQIRIVYIIIATIFFGTFYPFESRVFLTNNSLNDLNSKTLLHINQYDDTRDNSINSVGIASIPSQIIYKNILPIFIVYKRTYDPFFNIIIKQEFPKKDFLSDVDKMIVADKFFRLYLDDTVFVKNDNYFLTQHAGTQEIGFKSFVDITTLTKGIHSLSIVINKDILNQKASDQLYNSINNILSDHDSTFTRIPFYKELN